MRKLHILPEDLEIATLYSQENPGFDRGSLGAFLERNGLGINHHTHSDCYDRCEYINLVLDRLPNIGE